MPYWDVIVTPELLFWVMIGNAPLVVVFTEPTVEPTPDESKPLAVNVMAPAVDALVMAAALSNCKLAEPPPVVVMMVSPLVELFVMVALLITTPREPDPLISMALLPELNDPVSLMALFIQIRTPISPPLVPSIDIAPAEETVEPLTSTA